MPRDERRMTFVVVPHGGSGDLSTRSYEISYRKLRLALYAGGAIAIALFLMAASWFWLAAQAGRVQILQREVAELQKERQERERLARTVARMQATGAIDLVGRSDLRYELTAKLDNLRRLLDQEQLNGSVRLQGQASGDWPDLEIHGEMDVQAVRYQSYALDTLHLTYDGSQLGAQPEMMTQLTLRRARLGEFPAR